MDHNKNDKNLNKSENDNNREWSSLPEEIWSVIGNNLVSSPLDALRFRSVCSFFRSLIPLPYSSSSSSSSFPSPLPRFSFPIPPFPSAVHAFVAPTTLYRLDRPFQNDNTAGWIIKIQHPLPQRGGGLGKFRLLDPLSCHRIKDLISIGDADGGGFYLNDFRLTELTTSYALRYVQGSSSVSGVNKLIISPDSSSSAIFLIYDNGKLGFAKNGEDSITLIHDRILDFNDIILHRNQPYVVDRWGTVSWIDESLNLIQYSPPLFGHGHRKHFVAGEPFFIIDRYLDDCNIDAKYPTEGGGNFNIMHRHPRWRRRHDEWQPRTVDFKVYKLDEEWGKWVEVKCLGEQAFVLSYDCCFAVRAKEYVGFRENCIYFTEQFDMDFALRKLGRLGGCVFSLEDGTIENLPCTPGYSQLFWPPPLPTRLCSGQIYTQHRDI